MLREFAAALVSLAVPPISDVIRATKPPTNSLIAVLNRPSSSDLASIMFDTELGKKRLEPRNWTKLTGLNKLPPLFRSRWKMSQKVWLDDVVFEGSNEGEEEVGTTSFVYSMSKATMCSLRMSRCLMRNSWASVGDARAEIWLAAL